MTDNLIIGLTGPFSSGCTTIAESLEDHGWARFKLSDVLKEMKEGNRQLLQNSGNELRKNDIESGGGGGILVREAFDRIKNKAVGKNIVLECIKNPGEITELKKHPNSYLIAINAFFSTRWERAKKKGEKNWAEFKAGAERDKNEDLVTAYDGKLFLYGQEVRRCVEQADISMNNNTNYDDYDRVKIVMHNKMTQFIDLIQSPFRPFPSDDELFMNNAYCTSLKSRCLKRQVGAIIVINDKFVVSSGYNAVPLSEDDCRDEFVGKCYRDKKISEVLSKIKFCPECRTPMSEEKQNKSCQNSECKYYKNPDLFEKSLTFGKGLDICRALHAEEKAILQFPHLGGGVSLEGATLYTTTFPCMLCAKKILDVGINKVIYIEPYPMKEAFDMLKKANVKTYQFEGVKAQAFFKLYKRYDIN